VSELNGNWLTISFSEKFKKRHDNKYDYPLEKHVMVFLPNGEWRRYSPRMGWKRMLLEYKLENGRFLARPYEKIEFRKLGNYETPDTLYFEIKKSHKVTYQRLDDSVNISELDLSGAPKIEQ
jgi:hypothetical protein